MRHGVVASGCYQPWEIEDHPERERILDTIEAYEIDWRAEAFNSDESMAEYMEHVYHYADEAAFVKALKEVGPDKEEAIAWLEEILKLAKKDL